MFTIVSAAVRGFQSWRERQRVLNELYSMDDRSLADIGLRRADIPFVISAQTDLATEARPARSRLIRGIELWRGSLEELCGAA